MKKTTIVSLILIANLHGQFASANEVMISSARLQTISSSELRILGQAGAIRMQGGSVLLDMRKLDHILKDQQNVNDLTDEAQKMSSRFVPYGNTIEERTMNSEDIKSRLTTRYVPYGNT